MRSKFESPYDYEEITVGATAAGLTRAKVEAWKDSGPAAIVTVGTAAVCFRVDGGEPTAATVNQLESGDTLELHSFEEMLNFRAIRRDSADAKLGVTYYK